jgi:flagellar motor switch protein FliN
MSLALRPGIIIEFDKVVGESMDVIVGGRLMCRGEMVVANERYGIRISEVIRVEDSDKKLKPI